MENEELTKPDLNKPAFKIMPEAGEAIKENKCPTCSKEIKESDFKDALSRKEYSISGLCQSCQDKVFGEF